MQERLHKFMAHCGVASRRKAEALILDGRVKLNGRVVDQLGVKVDPAVDRVTVDGKALHAEGKVYLLLHKPRGVTSTADDERGRKTVLDLVGREIGQRVYPVGRLDRDSEGLLVLTNDGQMAFYLTHPSCEVRKLYQVVVEGFFDDEALGRLLEKGVRLGPVLVKPVMAKIVKRGKTNSTLQVVVGEGVNREVRRVFAALGHEVKKLTRLQVGPLSLRGIGKGYYRAMTAQELHLIRQGMREAGVAEDADGAGVDPGVHGKHAGGGKHGGRGRPGGGRNTRNARSGQGGKGGRGGHGASHRPNGAPRALAVLASARAHRADPAEPAGVAPVGDPTNLAWANPTPPPEASSNPRPARRPTAMVLRGPAARLDSTRSPPAPHGASPRTGPRARRRVGPAASRARPRRTGKPPPIAAPPPGG